MSAEAKELERILKENLITPVFQPIVDLQNGEIFAYEALSRGPQDSCLFRPDKLFTLAEKQNCLWRLDYLCRTQALLQAKNTLGDRKLFVNVDARVLYDKKFHQGSTAKLLKKFSLQSGSIVFEISEKSAITDYESFRSVLENYQCQDYKIAIDDVGAGYSGLNLLAQVSPEFIKIDIGLIKNIDTDPIKKAIVKSLADFSRTANIKTIAEGIERPEELKLLIELGINYGQGFYLGKPMPVLSMLSHNITEEISTIHLKKEEFRMHTRLNMSIGEIATQQTTFPSHTWGTVIIDYLDTMQARSDVVIVDDGKPVGLLSHEIFYRHMATTYGVSLYSKRPVKLLMDDKPLILDYTTSIEEASTQALARSSLSTYDSLIIVRDEKYYGTVTIKKLLEITTKLELNRARHANPLTGLPGNIMIEWELTRYIRDLIPFTAIYIDLDNFKVYNDIYGFESGDTVLVATADLLHNALSLHTTESFLGHIGGDDFIAFIRTEKPETICRAIIHDFDIQAKTFYSNEHQRQKYIIAKNRNGQTEKFPLMSISLAVLDVVDNTNLTTKSLAAKAAAIKKKCKAVSISNFIEETYNPLSEENEEMSSGTIY